MNKNLKKVISTIAAFAMSASTLVAFAADYPDVDASAKYKQAVDELSALDIINGYEDGTFQPDKLVTRAEFSKMLITMLGKAELAQAESAAGSNTVFTDVPGSHWASGYVTAAVTGGYINGMGNNIFAPDSNVTYAQAMKMLVCAAGYEQWAIQKNGAENAWPNSYLYYANQVDIGKGVSGVSDTTELTRAQCAQMIDNTLTAPVCVDTNEVNYDKYGNLVKKLEQKNGKGENYQCILSINHDAFKVKGMVLDTSKGGDSKVGEVKFEIQSAKNWNDDREVTKKDTETLTGVKTGNSGAEDFLNKYAEAILQQDDNEDWTILSITEAAQNVEEKMAAEDFDKIENGRIYFYSSNKQTSFKIDDAIKLYVNGVDLGEVSAISDEDIAKYIKNNTASDVTLVDVPNAESSSPDGKYDMLMVDYYVIAVVDEVDAEDEEDVTINTLEASEDFAWDGVDMTDEDKDFKFVKDNSEISVADLQQYDVLAIRYNVAGDFDQSSFYDVAVSSASVSGKCNFTGKNTNGQPEYTVDGTKYTLAYDGLGDLKAGNEYTIYLDVFGRIAYTEKGLDSTKLAILDSAYEVHGGSEYEAVIYLPDGTKATEELKDKAEYDKAVAILAKDADGNKAAVQNRVIEYKKTNSKLTINKVSDTQGLQKDETLGYVLYETVDGESYRATTNRIGSYRISEEGTAFIDAADDDDIKAMSVSSLVDGQDYTAYFYNKSRSDSTYGLVLITSDSNRASAWTNVAVFKSESDTTTDDDEATVAYTVYMGGQEKTIEWDPEYAPEEDYVEGDALMFDMNGSGQIKAATKLLVDFDGEYASVKAMVGADKDSLTILDDYAEDISSDNDTAEFLLGAVVARYGSTFDLAGITAENTSITTDIINRGLVEGSNVYVVDYNKREGNRISTGSSSSITSSISNSKGNTEIEWTKEPRVALVKVVNKDAIDVVVYIPNKN